MTTLQSFEEVMNLQGKYHFLDHSKPNKWLTAYEELKAAERNLTEAELTAERQRVAAELNQRIIRRKTALEQRLKEYEHT